MKKCIFYDCRSSLVNNSQAKEYVDVFLSHTVRPVTSIIQIVGHNRARQRDKWGHILEEMATLQDAVCIVCNSSVFYSLEADNADIIASFKWMQIYPYLLS